jgi:Phosphatidylinositol 3- and 4-kinase
MNRGPIENYSHSLFKTEEIHKIAVLDLRILNLDRNVCNILVRSTHPHCDIDYCLHD